MIDHQEDDHQKDADAAQALKDTALELQTNAFAHAQTYTAVVMFGGYAGLFAIWTLTKDVLSAASVHWSGLLMSISLLTFVLSEIFNTLVTTFNMLQTRKLLISQKAPAEIIEDNEKLGKRQKLLVQRLVLPVWFVSFIVSLLTGIGAAAVLISTFASGLGGELGSTK